MVVFLLGREKSVQSSNCGRGRRTRDDSTYHSAVQPELTPLLSSNERLKDPLRTQSLSSCEPLDLHLVQWSALGANRSGMRSRG